VPHRKLEERADTVRRLESTLERSNSTKMEHGQRLENPRTMSNGNSDDHVNPGVDNDLFEKYSNDVLENLRQNAPLIERLQKELSSAQVTLSLSLCLPVCLSLSVLGGSLPIFCLSLVALSLSLCLS